MTATTWCPVDGRDVLIDEDGCCLTCGSTAVGRGVDAALEALAHSDLIRAERDESRREAKAACTALASEFGGSPLDGLPRLVAIAVERHHDVRAVAGGDFDQFYSDCAQLQKELDAANAEVEWLGIELLAKNREIANLVAVGGAATNDREAERRRAWDMYVAGASADPNVGTDSPDGVVELADHFLAERDKRWPPTSGGEQ